MGKIKKWEDVDESVREKITQLRHIEKENIDKSGYITWKNTFLKGFFLYSIGLFLFLRKRYSDITLNLMCLYLSPMLPYGLILKNQYFKPDYYKEYYKAHSEINNELYKLKSKNKKY